MTAYLVAVFAGALTTLSPCVLPLLPIVLFGALERHTLAPLALATGMSGAYTVVGVVLASVGFAFDGGAIRVAAALALIVFGVVVWSDALQTLLSGTMSQWVAGLNDRLSRFRGSGLAGQFAVGALLGTVWVPCAGPTLGATIALASSSQTMAQAGAMMLFFSVGASMPLLLLAYGSRRTFQARRESMARLSRRARPWLAGLLVLIGVLVLSGADRVIEARLVDALPAWLVDLTTRY